MISLSDNNPLPVDLRTGSDTAGDFKNKLKTYLVKLAFDISVDTIINFCFIHHTHIFSVLLFFSFIATLYCSMFLRQFVIGAL